MPDQPNQHTLYDRAYSLAEDLFETDDSNSNSDKVCAVALSIQSDMSVSFFSGAPGYKMLVHRVGGNARDAQNRITNALSMFLKSSEGGGFTQEQITRRAYAPHGRGAMNCAEPKVYYYLHELKMRDTRDWVIIPFNRSPNGIVYNPPCQNCRRWVYGKFNDLSRVIALAYGGPGALDA